MKFEDVKGTTWGLLTKSNMFEDGFFIMIEEYDYDTPSIWDEIHELSFVVSDGSEVGKFLFFKELTDLGKYMERNGVDLIDIAFHNKNNKILILGK